MNAQDQGWAPVEPGQAWQLVASHFERWYRKFVHYSYGMTGNLADSEDAVQEVYLRLYLQLHEGKRIERPEGWMFCVLRREIRNQQQKRLKEETFDPNIRAIQSARDNSLVDSRFPEVALEGADLAKLLWVLTPREREVIGLRLADLKYREIAEILEISTSSVNTLLARAIGKLRKAVKKKQVRDSQMFQGQVSAA